MEARFQGKSKFFAGSIAAVNDDGTFTVQYGDGEKEDNVPSSFIRVVNNVPTTDEIFEKGTSVEGNFKNAGKWYKGKIIRRHENGTSRRHIPWRQHTWLTFPLACCTQERTTLSTKTATRK